MSRFSLSERRAPQNWSIIYIAVALTAAAILLLELALTRIFSVVFYYHFAFLAISIALFGLGAGGILSYLIWEWRGAQFAKLGLLSAANSLVVLASLIFLLTRGPTLGTLELALVYFASAAPFVLAGAILSIAIGETVQRVDRVYFFDLIGAAGGCLLLIPLLNQSGGPNTVIAAAALFAATSALWFTYSANSRGRVAGVVLALGLVGFILFNTKAHWVDIGFAKGRSFEREIFSQWNSFSRVALVPQAGYSNPYIVIDADAGTAIPRFQFDALTPADRQELFGLSPGLPYLLRPGAKTLIIGPGGGWDVARAIASGSRDVTGVEINPIIAETIMQERFSHYSDGLYLRPEVRIVVEDGRAFVRRTEESYGILQATLVDTWASTAAGAFALTENNLYTSEAFHDYLRRLEPRGIMSFTRWGFEPPRESLRLVTLSMEALGRMGIKDPTGHVIVVRENAENVDQFGALDTVLVSRSPFTREDIAIVDKSAGTRFQPIYMPDRDIGSAFTRLLRAPDAGKFLREYPYDVTPVSDNRPFFFYTVQARDLWSFFRSAGGSADYNINRAIPLLFQLLVISLVATAVMVALPPLVLGARLPQDRNARFRLAFFLCIGAGYILVEIALIQKFVLLLGQPTYALTVILFTMLTSSGAGSFFSRRVVGLSARKLSNLLVGIFLGALLLSVSVTHIVNSAVSLPWVAKLAVTVALIAPLGFVMGMPFPAGLRRMEREHPGAVRWAWALNAAASVLGSVFAIFFAIYLGLWQALLIGGVMYLGALAAHRVPLSKGVTSEA